MNTLIDWLRAADPAAVAVADGTEELVYSDLLEQSANLAETYSSTYGQNRFLLLPAQRSVQFVRALVAVSFSGNVPVPIDPTMPDNMLAQIGACCGDWELVELDMQPTHGESRPVDRSEASLPALVLFTSGTSGTPKGVPVSWRNLEHSVKTVSNYLQYGDYPSAAIVLPLHYSYALLTQLMCMFYVGGRARLFESFRNPIKFARLVGSEELQTFCGVPSTYHAICALHRMAPLHMPNIRVLCSAGSAMDRSLMPEIKEIFPNSRFFDNYGMTEATPRIAYLTDDDPRFGEPTCGKAIDGVEIQVLDEHKLTPVEDGQRGIIAVRGPNVFDGYLNDPESTKNAFSHDGYLLSGDYGHVRDNYIYIEGRADDIFNVGGEKVAPLEIERALSDHSDIISSCAGKIDDPQRGTLPVAYIQTDSDISRRDLIDFLQDRLPPAKIPSRYFKVRSFPMTTNGKLQRLHLSPDNKTYVIKEIV